MQAGLQLLVGVDIDHVVARPKDCPCPLARIKPLLVAVEFGAVQGVFMVEGQHACGKHMSCFAVDDLEADAHIKGAVAVWKWRWTKP